MVLTVNLGRPREPCVNLSWKRFTQASQCNSLELWRGREPCEPFRTARSAVQKAAGASDPLPGRARERADPGSKVHKVH